MEFDKSKVYTALNADESLIGAKGYFADCILTLKTVVKHNHIESCRILSDFENDCFKYNDKHIFNFFYLVEPAPEKWYVYKIIGSDNYTNPVNYPISVNQLAFEGTKEECEKWVEEHSKPKYRPFKDCDELITSYCNKVFNDDKSKALELILKCKLELPTIWVKDKYSKEISLITRFCDDSVILDSNLSVTALKELFENYTFLDGSVCGVEE